ncbi:MAG: glycosyltransferase, partial [Anaerolineaceae bacterium]|nr:glycosyltransferase [Anaerolineaceae bacterium]
MSKALRIIHVITGLDTGGAEMMLYRLLTALDQEEFSSQIISVTGDGPMGDKIRALDVPVMALGMKSVAGGPAATLRLARWLRQNPPDVMQTWMYHADLVGSLAVRLVGGIPLVWGLHNSVLDANTSKRTTHLTVKMLSRLSHFAPDRILSCSQTASDLHIGLGYDAGRMVQIPNGFDLTNFYADSSARLSVRQELDIAPETLLIGAVGRFDPQKDYPNLISAAGWL